MFHYKEESGSRCRGGAYFHPYDGATGSRSVGSVPAAHSRQDVGCYPMMEDEPMDVQYEDSRYQEERAEDEQQRQQRQHNSTESGGAANLDLQLSASADHLMALLQREANDYSAPLPIQYYPTEFAELDTIDGDNKGSGGKKATIGPWRKRIASWMYDVVDHFQYDRNVVAVALRYIDQYVGYLLAENDKNARRGRQRRDGSGSSGGQPVKRRHFQLIAVTSLYLAIKIHGELIEDDPVSGAEYDVVESLIHEVDGRAFLGKPLDDDSRDNGDADAQDDDDDVCSHESDDDLRAVSHKLADLKRRHRKGRWNMSQRLSQFGLPLQGLPVGDRNGSRRNHPDRMPREPKRPHSDLPYKPRKRGMLSGPLRLHSFVELSRGLFTSKDITDTERRILVALNYVVNPPTSRRFVGEMLRLLALSHRAVAESEQVVFAERTLGLDRREILKAVLTNACEQIEGAAGVPSLSIGCVPSMLAYGAVVNAVEEEFDNVAAMEASADGMEMEGKDGSPQLEDFQRHYRRYSRNQSPTPSVSNIESDRNLFLEAWKGQFLVAVFHATNCFFSPDSEDVFKIRELLLDHVKDTDGVDSPASDAAPSSTSPESSPTESTKLQEGTKKRSPRSPRSVIIAGSNPRMLRGGSSFFSRQGSSTSNAHMGRAASASSLSGNAFRSFSSSSNAPQAHHRAYFKQVSEPIYDAADSGRDRFTRSQTPEVSHFMNQTRPAGDYEGSWRSTGEAFHPPQPNPPFFSA